MKKSILVFVAIAINWGCGGRAVPEPSAQNRSGASSGHSKDFAIEIARSWGKGEFDFDQCDVDVADEGGLWKVEFSRKPQFQRYEGGCPTLWVDKVDGQIRKVLPNK